MVNCCVTGCESRTSRPRTPNVSFFRFPNDTLVRNRWLRRMNRKDFIPSEHSRVCSRHFRADCFQEERELKETAVPSIFPRFPKIPRKRRIKSFKTLAFDSDKENAPPSKCKDPVVNISLVSETEISSIPHQSVQSPKTDCSLHSQEKDTSLATDSPTIAIRNPIESVSFELEKESVPTQTSRTAERDAALQSEEMVLSIDLRESIEDQDSKDFPVCKFVLNRPFLRANAEEKKEAFSFSTVCPKCNCSFSCIVDKNYCQKHILSNSIEKAKSSEAVILDFPEVVANEIPIIDISPIPPLTPISMPILTPAPSSTPEPSFEPPPLPSTSSSSTDLPDETILLKAKLNFKNKKLKALRMRSYRARNRLASYKNLIDTVRKSDYLNSQTKEELEQFGEVNKELLERQLKVARNAGKKKLVQPCGQALKTFALTLNYYSPKAYEYVRKSFNKILPHPRTLSRWYTHLEGDPGLTKEAFETLKKRNSEKILIKGKPVCGHIILDEMNIMKKVEFDGTRYYGYVDNGIDIGSNNLATEALVFMFVSADEEWKIPLGYFMVDSLSAEIKENLLKQCLASLHEAGVFTLSVTFDGASCNLTMINNLGVDIKKPEDFESMKTYFICPYSKRKIFIFYDMCHMFKLVRNFLADLKILKGGEDDLIEWKYFEDLLEIQEVEGLHLANKLKTQHVHFQNYKMKVKLASQLLSESVAQAFEILKKLNIKDFPHAGPTIKFVKLFNNLFDAFNSKPKFSVGFKKSINPENFKEFEILLKDSYEYIKNLTFKKKKKKKNKTEPDEFLDFPVYEGKRKIGFLGFLISIKSLIDMYKHTVANSEDADVIGPNSHESVPLLKQISTHRFCQDHIEIFFGIIRQHGGHRKNPTSWQFKTAYKKCLVHLQLMEVKTGNCVSAENISILSCNRSGQEKEISLENIEENEECDDDELIFDLTRGHKVDHFYEFQSQELTTYTKIVVTYIAGNVIKTCKKVLKCPACTEAMLRNPVKEHCLLIEEKNEGGLITPGEDIMDIVFVCEKLIRQILANSGGRFIQPEYSTSKLISIVNKAFSQEEMKSMFLYLDSSLLNSEQILTHKTHLFRTFCASFFSLRLRHICRKSVESAENKRNYYSKLCDFAGT